MNPVKSKYFLILALCVIPLWVCSQTVTIEGRLVEHAGSGKRLPVKGVKISIFPYGEDVTRSDGSFAIDVPKNKSHIMLELGSQDYEILSPNAGMVMLPPFLDMVEVLVSGNNVRPEVKNRVAEVNSKVKKLQAERRLNERQIIRLHKLMIDTVLHYETEVFFYRNQIARMENDLRSSTSENQLLRDSISRLNANLMAMNQKVASLSDQLFVALEEKYLRQQNHLEDITQAIQDYVDRVNDLNDWLGQITNYFRHQQAQVEINNAIREYNNAWKKISVSYDGHASAVRHYWEDRYLSADLENTYDFILNDVHKAVLHRPFNDGVIRPLQDWASRTMGLSAAKKRVTAGASEARLKLQTLIPILENNVDKLKTRLKNSI